MVAADHDLMGQVLHQPPTPHLNRRRPAMRRLAQLAEATPKILPDRLHPEADAEDRQFLLQRSPDRFGDAEILRPARAGRQHQKVPALLFQHFQLVNMPNHGDGDTDMTPFISTHMDTTDDQVLPLPRLSLPLTSIYHRTHAILLPPHPPPAP